MKNFLALWIVGLGIQISWTIEKPELITNFKIYKGTYSETGPTQMKYIATVKRTTMGPRFIYNYQLKDITTQLFGVSAVDKGGRESAIITNRDDGTPVIFPGPSSPAAMNVIKQP